MLSPLGHVSLFMGCLAILYALFRTSPSPCTSLCPTRCPTSIEHLHSGYFGYECAGKPHHSSWSSWWHPERSDGNHAEHKLGAGAITKDWNILYHLGGNGPWVEKVIDVVDEGIAVPEGCSVGQVHMVGDGPLLSWLEAGADVLEDVQTCREIPYEESRRQ